MKYIILIVDGRGTGFKGRDLRDPVRGKLGTYEAIDQIAVARTWASTKNYVDKRRVGIWGWSFGGCQSSFPLPSFPRECPETTADISFVTSDWQT